MSTSPNSAHERYEMRRARRAGRVGLTGPVVLIALGVLFLLGQFVPDWGVGRTWPAIMTPVLGMIRTRMTQATSDTRKEVDDLLVMEDTKSPRVVKKVKYKRDARKRRPSFSQWTV